MDAVAAPPTYRRLLAVPGFRRLAGATVLARTATSMQALVLVLFVLQRFHSPPLAGLVVLLSLLPGIVVSPLAGALLDRHRRMLLINADYAAAALALASIAILDRTATLSAPLLLLIVSVASLTNPLSNSGTRSLFPVMVPRPLWERVNAVDSGAYVVAAIAGPGAAGVLIGVVGAQGALLATAAGYVAALVMLLGMREPDIERMPSASLLSDALGGLRYVIGHRQLRGLAVTTAVSNIAFGTLTVAMPVLLLSRDHAGDAVVGAMWAVLGVAGLCSGMVAGRLDSENREARFIAVGAAINVLSMLCLLTAAAVGGGVVLVAAGMALFGAGNGPFDIGLFSLRQRVTAPAWMGRAFAVSMSLNFVGMPIGSAVAGPVADHSLTATFALAVLTTALGGLAAMTMLRPPRSPADAAPATIEGTQVFR